MISSEEVRSEIPLPGLNKLQPVKKISKNKKKNIFVSHFPTFQLLYLLFHFMKKKFYVNTMYELHTFETPDDILADNQLVRSYSILYELFWCCRKPGIS